MEGQSEPPRCRPRRRCCRIERGKRPGRHDRARQTLRRAGRKPLKTTFTIAIDGPAAAGKGTLSRRIADEYGFHHLDTGLTYRATAKALIDAALPLDDEAVAEKIAREVEL